MTRVGREGMKMKVAPITLNGAPARAVCAVASLAVCLTLVRPAGAWSDDGGRDDDWGSGWSDYNWSQERMQGERIASQEERSREAGREKRREEVAKEREQKSAETQAYYAAVLDASKASLNAPRGVYYRKPGFASAEAPPAGSPVVTVGQMSLIYDRGLYWFSRGAEFVVVVPPAGVVVDTLPAGVRAQRTKEGMLYYFFGVFYRGKDGAYEVVAPPAGTIVGYLPDGYSREAGKDGTVFRFGESSFRQVFLQGVLAYQTI